MKYKKLIKANLWVITISTMCLAALWLIGLIFADQIDKVSQGFKMLCVISIWNAFGFALITISTALIKRKMDKDGDKLFMLNAQLHFLAEAALVCLDIIFFVVLVIAMGIGRNRFNALDKISSAVVLMPVLAVSVLDCVAAFMRVAEKFKKPEEGLPSNPLIARERTGAIVCAVIITVEAVLVFVGWGYCFLLGMLA